MLSFTFSFGYLLITDSEKISAKADDTVCKTNTGTKDNPNPIIADSISNILVDNASGGDYINKTINITYSYDPDCVGVTCSIPDQFTLHSAASSHEFSLNVQLDNETNCTFLKVTGFLPVDAENSILYTVQPKPKITIEYIPPDP